MKKILGAIAALLILAPGPIWAQSNPGLVYGQTPSATQWNSYFSAKQDYSPILSNIVNGTTPITVFTQTTNGVVPAPITVSGRCLTDNGTWQACGGTPPVSSVFGRTGAVVAASGDYTFAQIGSTPTTIAGYGITDAVSLTDVQTLTNKTLTAPIIATISNTGTLTLPTITDTLVGRATTDTLTNKTLTSPTINAGALSGTFTGTPVLNLTSATSLPIATGVSGLGTGIATWLGTPSSANLRAALTDETGTGLAYFQGGALGTPASGVGTNLTGIPLTTAVTGTLPIANGGTGTGTAGVPLLTSIGALTGTASSSTFLRGDGSWATPAGSGNVTAGATLTSNQLVIGQGTQAVATLGSLGTTTTVLHGNAAGAPTFGSVNLATDVSGSLPTNLLTNVQNAQTGTTYTLVASDGGKTVIGSNAAAQTYTLPQANTAGFTAGYASRLANNGAGTITMNTTTSLFPNGLSSISLLTGQALDYESDGTNYPVAMVGLPVAAQATVIGRASGSGTNYPVVLTATQLTALVNTFTNTLSGAVPASGGGTTNYLRADGTWAAPPSAASPTNWQAGSWYNAFNSSVNTGVNITATVIEWVPVYFDRPVTIGNIGARISTASAGGNMQYAVYASGSNGFATGSALCTTANISTASTGSFDAACSGTPALPSAGWYWFGFQVDNATAAVDSSSNAIGLNSRIGASSHINLSGSNTNFGTEYKTTGATYGTWPTNPTITQAASSANTIPMIQFSLTSVP